MKEIKPFLFIILFIKNREPIAIIFKFEGVVHLAAFQRIPRNVYLFL